MEADVTPRQQAQAIINKVSAAMTSSHQRKPPGLLDLLLRRHPVEIDALLLHTIRGQAAISMNPVGQLIIRPRGDPSLVRYLAETLDGAGSWDEHQRGWRIHRDDGANVLARIISDRSPIQERNSGGAHPAAPPRPVAVVIHTRYAVATGDRLGDAVTIRVTDARLRAALAQQLPCGTYEEKPAIDIWRFEISQMEVAQAWAEALR